MTSSFSRRILLAVTGLTPQVVTETVYALAVDSDAPWVPTEIHLITTTTGKENARLNLFGPKGWFDRLRADYALPPIEFTPERIHVLKDASGAPLDDIRDQLHNTLAADFIVDKVRALSADAEAELHVSIAGGRKTMGYYLGYALSLYGRPQDRLSHVLVSEPYETNREFYYPTPYEHPIHSGRGNGKEVTVDARDAKVELASIPFVRLRSELPSRLLREEAKLSHVVAVANRGLQAPLLELDVEKLQVRADGEIVPMGPAPFLVLLWHAVRARRDEAPTDYRLVETADEFMRLAAEVSGHLGKDSAQTEDALTWRRKDGSILEYFGPLRSRVNKAFADVLGVSAAKRYQLPCSKSIATLNLAPEEIAIHAPRTLRAVLQ